MTTEDYILSHIDPEPQHLTALNRHTQLHHLYGHQCSGHYQGRLLSMISHMTRPKRIVELGCFTGYSTLCLAEGLAPDGELHTIEINDEDADELTERFADDTRIHLHIGDALQLLTQIPGNWDLAFIDANKRHYCEYLDLLIPRMAPNGIILADNTLWGGKITDPTASDAQTEGIRRFNDMIASRPELHVIILPIRDGLTIIRPTH
ncbi:MAG: O-methyltransferase [Muribaculaceae bacterium]|nr:O-methyltransferase [Muribaculaceae bacterium]